MLTRVQLSLPALLSLSLALGLGARALADETDPPTRAARLSHVDGSVSFEPAGTQDWVAATVNRPLTNGDKLWDDRDSRSEIQLDGSTLRLWSETAVSVLNINDTVTQIQMTAGTLIVRVRRLDDDRTYEIDTPNLAFSVLRPGTYRLSVDEAGDTTSIRVRDGQGEVTGGGSAVTVGPGEFDVFSGTDQLTEDQPAPPPDDDFDAWSADRDARWARAVSSRYVSPEVVGYEDLDDAGSWQPVPQYGEVWFPRGVGPEWAPYHTGHWSYISPWGYTWVDDEPWGYAPFHYGRWVSYRGTWGWVPAPPPPPDAPYARPVYAPALVAWVGVGAGIAWFALGPREVYVPPYPVSRGYVDGVNVSNTTVNTTIVNNVYNTTVINNNRTVNVTNITYVNRAVPGAVAATTQQAFTSAQPVARNPIKLDQRALATAPVRVATPALVPSKQAVLGAARPSSSAPPARVASREVVARTAPPPAPPSFEREVTAIRNNAGKPLSVAQVRQVEGAQPQRAAVRLAPAVTPRPAPRPMGSTASARPAATAAAQHGPAFPQAARSPEPPARTETPRPVQQSPQSAAPRTDRPPAASSAPRPAPNPRAVHPNDLPKTQQAAAPSSAASALERQHLQAQAQLQAEQQKEREQVQRQQEEEHQRLAQQQKQQQDEARRQQLEQQHQQQTQALQRQQEAQRQQLEERQAQERQKQESANRPPAKKTDRPPGAH